MPFVKDNSYQSWPFSNETPRDPFYCYLSVTDMIVKVTQNRLYAFRCRTVGTVSCEYGLHILHEIDNYQIQIRLSLACISHTPPFTGKPYSAQVFGFVLWKEGSGPILYPALLKSVHPDIALRLHETMNWVVATHNAFLVEKQEE